MNVEPLVLLVGNDRHREASALAEILTDEGIDVIDTRVGSRLPDIIVVDDDVAPLSELRALVVQLHDRFPGAVTVLMTSWCGSEPAIRAVLAPVDGICIEKPIDVRMIVTLARDARDRRSAQQRVTPSEAGPT